MLAEIKAIIYAIIAAGTFYLGWHTRSVVDDDKAANIALAQAKVVEVQLAANAAKQQADQQVATQVQQNYEQRLQASSASNATLNSLLHQYEVLLSGPVPAVPGAPGLSISSSGGPDGLAGFNQAVANAITSCTDDSTRLQGWQDWYRGVQVK